MAKISTYTSKTTPVDADSLPMTDSADSNNTKRLTWANLKATLLSYFSGIYQPLIVSGTAQATTSGTEKDFTGIPSTVKRITVMLNGVSTNGTDNLLIQIGDAGGIETSGYLSGSQRDTGVESIAGFIIQNVNATVEFHGLMILTLIDASTFTWVASHTVYVGGISATYTTSDGAGSKSLSATLDRVRLTTTGGANTFDAGKVNILYE